MKLPNPLLPICLAILGYSSLTGGDQATEINFSRDIRPILSEHCFKCHGPDVAAAAGNLRLDSFAGATARVIVPGKPNASILLNRVGAVDPAMRMPPSNSGMKPLKPAQISLLRAWIGSGAKYSAHWAFIPPTAPKIPSVKDKSWVKNPIDAFVLAKLEQGGLKPEPQADLDTLALRAAQTLTGLPPTRAQMATLHRDTKPGAYERFVDELLATPAYGEHEARYWMDAVRYGDTHGLQLDNERTIYPYRDWVIRAFNADLPFDQFVKWQVAGDLLTNPTTEQMIATGYVRMNLTTNEGGAIAEEFLARNTFDRVDTTSTVMLGLTVGCAKCHDHKYDPIRQRDYYGLYAYFNSTQDDPLDGNIALPQPVMPAPNPDQEQRLRRMRSQELSLLRTVDPREAAEWLEANVTPVPTSRDWQISPVYSAKSFDEAFDQSAPEEPGKPGPGHWTPLQYELGKDAPNLIRKDNAYVYVKGTISLSRSGPQILRIGSDDGIRLWLNGKLIHSHKIGRGLDAPKDLVTAEFKAGDNEIVAKVVNGISIDGLNIGFGPLGVTEAKALARYRKSPDDLGAQDAVREVFLNLGPDSAKARAYRASAQQRAQFEAAIPMTLIAKEMTKPRPTFILKRGQYDQLGPSVVRHIPSALGNLPAGAANNRLGLANWLVSRSNPLVTRVFVNRIWQQHFGVGIVKTVEDFGSQGEWPANQALLDYLATQFVANGWSVKKLNRMLVTSAAFRQSSRITAVKLAKDPENRLISRGPRFRLEAEVIRDKALFAGGLLVQRSGGHGFKPYQPDGLWEGSSDPASSTHFYVQDHGPETYRRSMYMFWKRTSPPPAMITFDAPLRDTCIVRRSTTNTPLQALALLNEPTFLEASRAMGARLLRAPGSDQGHLNALFELTLNRRARPDELALLTKSLSRYRLEYTQNPAAATKLLAVGESAAATNLAPAEQAAWMILCSSLMNTDEFLTQH